MKFLLLLCAILPFLTVEAQFQSEDELSIVLTGGNTDLKTYNLGSKNSYTWGKNKFILSGAYTYGESDEIRSAERWNLLFRYDREILKQLSLFLAELIEANRFAGFSRRYNTDFGSKYTFYKTEKNTSFLEAGFRYTLEEKVDESLPDDKDAKGRLYAETNHHFNKLVKGKFWIEYVPNFSVSEDYLVNFEPSLNITLNDIFSLKVAYLWNYDNLPAPGNGKHDTTYSTSLIANF